MAKWTQTLSSKKPCRIKRDQIVAVVDKKKGHVEVFLRGGQFSRCRRHHRNLRA